VWEYTLDRSIFGSLNYTDKYNRLQHREISFVLQATEKNVRGKREEVIVPKAVFYQRVVFDNKREKRL
jgi:hypothetical protein